MRPPKTVMVSAPQPFHPNWFTSKNWCFGTWSMSEALGDHVIRMVKTLQFDLDITNEHSPANGAVTLYLLPSAFEEIRAHISWGKRTRGNVRGQGGILIGSVYRDRGTDFVCGVARHIVPAARAGDATYIQFTHADWIEMYRELEARFTAAEGEEQLSVIGWYHTHPDIPGQMSGIDKSAHTSFFSHPWQFSVILNPQRKVWAVFNGALCGNCSGYLYPPPVAEAEAAPPPSHEPEPQPEVPEPQPERPFVIKRRSPMPIYRDAPQSRGPMTQRYPGGVLPVGRTCYYYPVNLDEIPAGKSYIISDALVRRLAAMVDGWGLSGGESLALIYHLTETAPAAPLPVVGPLGDLLGRLTAPLDGRAVPELRYVQTEYDGISRGERPLAIDRRLLAQRVQCIMRYEPIGRDFSMVISYKTVDHPGANRSVVNPWGKEFSRVRVLGKDGRGKLQGIGLKHLDSEARESRFSKLALVISNGDVDIDAIRHKLMGHLTAMCLNIETGGCRFYRLF